MSYFTLIEADSPGAIGSLGQEGTVQPQEPFALEITKGSFPVFLNTNSQFPSAYWSMVPQSCVSFSNSILAPDSTAACANKPFIPIKAENNKLRVNSNFFTGFKF